MFYNWFNSNKQQSPSTTRGVFSLPGTKTFFYRLDVCLILSGWLGFWVGS